MVLLLWIIYVIYVLCLSCVRVCSLLPCGHLKGKGWPLGSCLLCYCDFVTFPFGILGQVWYLIVSIRDPCCCSYFKRQNHNGSANGIYVLTAYLQKPLIDLCSYRWRYDLSITICPSTENYSGLYLRGAMSAVTRIYLFRLLLNIIFSVLRSFLP